MTAQILDGKEIAKALRLEIKDIINIKRLRPSLAIILANDHVPSKIYVQRKMAACEEAGITATLHTVAPDQSTDDILDLVERLNNDKNVHGVFLQLPVNPKFDGDKIIQSINPAKDVDGLTHHNMGALVANSASLVPCTPQGVMRLLNETGIDLSGKHAVIIGRSLLFGKPMGQLLLHADCTATQCHSKTKDLKSLARQADILICATGQAGMVKQDWVKDNAIVIDVGITQTDDGKIVGDVDFYNVLNVAGHITPVPGGVGPMTVACLLANTVKACQNS